MSFWTLPETPVPAGGQTTPRGGPWVPCGISGARSLVHAGPPGLQATGIPLRDRRTGPGAGSVSGKLKGCEPATRCSTRTKPQRVLPCTAFTRRSPRRASHPGSRSGCTPATCATAGTSPRSPSKAGVHRGTMTLTGFALRAPRIFSSGPPKSSQGHADNGSEPGGDFSGRHLTAAEGPCGPSARVRPRRAWAIVNTRNCDESRPETKRCLRVVRLDVPRSSSGSSTHLLQDQPPDPGVRTAQPGSGLGRGRPGRTARTATRSPDRAEPVPSVVRVTTPGSPTALQGLQAVVA